MLLVLLDSRTGATARNAGLYSMMVVAGFARREASTIHPPAASMCWIIQKQKMSSIATGVAAQNAGLYSVTIVPAPENAMMKVLIHALAKLISCR